MPPKKPGGSKKRITNAKNATPSPTPPPPNWPALAPVLPASDLYLKSIIPGQIVTISNFFTATLCRNYVNFLQKEVVLSTTPGKPKRGEAVRVNDRFQIQDEAFAERLWRDTGLAGVVAREDRSLWGGEVVGLNPNIRIYRYSTGQFFDKHYDDENQFSSGGEPAIALKTTWTLLVYLTGTADGIKGGETVFYTEATKRNKSETVVAPLIKGTALLHKHGRDCMLHEGRLVEDDAGTGKWVLRSDLAVRR